MILCNKKIFTCFENDELNNYFWLMCLLFVRFQLFTIYVKKEIFLAS